jgi:hypothetical protein
MDYEDDAHWCEQMRTELALERVELKERSGLARGFEVHLQVEPGIDLLRDPRVPRLIRDALSYRKATGAMIESGGIDSHSGQVNPLL